MIKQIAIFIENQKGSLRRVVSTLHSHEIRIYGLSTIDTPEFGILRMIVDDPGKAVQVVPETGFVAKACEVIAVELQSQKDMDRLLQVVEDGNVNINYIYSTFGRGGSGPLMIVHADDMDETEAMLRGRGFCCLDRVTED